MNELPWEIITEPEYPIPLSKLEMRVARGAPFTLADDRPILYAEALSYWNRAQARIMVERADELISVLQKGDEEAVLKKSARIVGDGLKHRLTGASFDGEGKLFLALSSTSYRDFQGTNVQAIENAGFRTRLMEAGLEDYADSNHHFANALGIYAAIWGFERNNKYTVVSLRSDKVMVYPSFYSVFCGLVESDDGRSDVQFAPNMIRELKEELGLEHCEIGAPLFHSLIRQSVSRIPDAILSAPFSLDKKALFERWRSKAEDKFENQQLIALDFADIPYFLDKNSNRTDPGGIAALSQLYKCRDLLQV